MRLKGTIVGLVLLAAAHASAQDAAEPRRLQSAEDATEVHPHYELPKGIRCTYGGVEYRCFNMEETKLLLKIDAELTYQQRINEKNQVRILRLEETNTQLLLAVAASERKFDTLKLDYDLLFDKWKKENKLRLEAENKPVFGSWVPWGLSAALAVVAGTLLVVK